MGCFDTLVTEDGYSYQTKALGKNLQTYKIGGEVPKVRHSSMTEEEYELAPTHPYEDLPDSYYIQIYGDSGYEYALIREGVFTEVEPPTNGATVFDYYGNNESFKPVITADPLWLEVRRGIPRRINIKE